MALLTSEAKLWLHVVVILAVLGLVCAFKHTRTQLEDARATIVQIRAEKVQAVAYRKAAEQKVREIENSVEAYKAQAAVEAQRAKNATTEARKAREQFNVLAAQATLNPPPSDAQGALEWIADQAKKIQEGLK